MKIATIARNPADSPQMVDKDAAILNCIEQELTAMGHSVTRLNEMDDFCGYDAVCHMSRSHKTLQQLKQAEANGCRITNTPTAVTNCSRTRQMTILQQRNIPQPEFQILTGDTMLRLDYPGWIKKGEGWSQRKEDVAFVTNEIEAKRAIAAIGGTTVYCKHIEGDVIKFYGVKNIFFTHCYPNPEKTKFGWEKVNGTTKHHPFNIQTLKDIAFAAAEAADLDIFGGDCIITPEGNIYIIDLNDFPSFSAVQNEAARHIAKVITDKEYI